MKKYCFLLIILSFSLLCNEVSFEDSVWNGEPIDQVTEEIKQLCGETCSGPEEQIKIATRAKEIERQYIQDFTNWIKQMPPEMRDTISGLTYDDSKSPRENEVTQPHKLRELFNDEGFIDILIQDHPSSPPVNRDQLMTNFTKYYNSLGALSVLKFQCINSNPEDREACPLQTELPKVESIKFNPTSLSSQNRMTESEDTPSEIPKGKIPATDPRCQDIVQKSLALDEKAGELGPQEYTRQRRELANCVNWCSDDVKERYPLLCAAQEAGPNSDRPPIASLSHQREDGFIQYDGRSIACDAGWLSQNFYRRNWNERQIDCAISGSSLEIFREDYYHLLGSVAANLSASQAGNTAEGEIFQNSAPLQSSYLNYPDLVRMTAISKFLNGYCDLTGNVPANVPDSCSPYQKGIQNYRCNKEVTPDKPEYIKTAKQLRKLHQEKARLNELANSEIYKGVRDFIATGIAPNTSTLMGLSPTQAYTNYSALTAQIDQVDASIVELSGKFPLLMSGLSTDTPIEDQDLTNEGIISELSQLDENNINQRTFNRLYKKAKSNAGEKFSSSLNSMCDARSGITDDQIILMPEFTGPTLQKFPQYEVAQLCLESRFGPEDMKQLIDDAAIPGAAIGCLAASIGPQAVAVGAICGAMFAGHGYYVYQREKNKLIQIQECRQSTRGQDFCDNDEYLAQKSDYDHALLNLQISIATLPLDIVLPGAIEYGPRLMQALRSADELPIQEAIRLAKSVEDELMNIRKITNPEEQAQALEQLITRIKSHNDYNPIDVVAGAEDTFSIIQRGEDGRQRFIPFTPGTNDVSSLENFTIIERTSGYEGGKLIEMDVEFPQDPLFFEASSGLTSQSTFKGGVAHGITYPVHSPALEIYQQGDSFLYPKLGRANEVYERLGQEFSRVGLSNNVRFVDDSVVGSAENFYGGMENFIRQLHCPGGPPGSLCWPMGADGIFHLHDIGAHYSKLYQLPEDVVRQVSHQTQTVSNYLDFLDGKYQMLDQNLAAFRDIKTKMTYFQLPDGSYDISKLTDFYSSEAMTPTQKELFDQAFQPDFIVDTRTGDFIVDLQNKDLIKEAGENSVSLNFERQELYFDIELRGIKQMKKNIVTETGEQIESIGTGKIRQQSQLVSILERSPRDFIEEIAAKKPEFPAHLNAQNRDWADYAARRMEENSTMFLSEFSRTQENINTSYAQRGYWEYEEIMRVKKAMIDRENGSNL